MSLSKRRSPLAYLVILVFGLLLATGFFISSNAKASATTETCAKVQNVEIPKSDYPSNLTLKDLKGCDSEKLYFGIGVKPDPVKARDCAILETKQEQQPFNGYSMLMMIYANGLGAEKNLDLALKLACNHVESATAELQARVEHLVKLKAENWQGNNFSICDDITSGFMAGACAAHEARITDAQRDASLQKIIQTWTDKQKSAFHQLLGITHHFIEEHAGNEIDLTGTARGQFFIEEKEKLLQDFLGSIKNFEQNKFPKYSTQDLANADKQLNAVYKELLQMLKDKAKDNFSTINKEGVVKTQKIWLKYRNEWVNFVHNKYPAIDDNSIKTWLTRIRIQMLENILKLINE